MTTKSLKDVFDEAQQEIENWPDWKKSLLQRAREADTYFAAHRPRDLGGEDREGEPPIKAPHVSIQLTEET